MQKSAIGISADELFMQRALDIARLGWGFVSPNPMVGCVIVKNDAVIAEGWHQRFGQAHAEVNALRTVPAGTDLANATAYVTLEPCSHYGKTPPCAQALINSGIGKVVVATTDPNPVVAGKGIALLKQAGTEVVTGVLEQQARWQNRRFFTSIAQQRPYVVLKWAQTADGFIARSNNSSKWISNWLSRRLVHQWRAKEDAILVGWKTAETDNPALSTRSWPSSEAPAKSPLPVVIDRYGKLDYEQLQLFKNGSPTLCYTTIIPVISQHVQLPEENYFNRITGRFAQAQSAVGYCRGRRGNASGFY